MSAHTARVEETLINVGPTPPAGGSRKPILFNSRKMATAKRELSAWARLPASEFPRKSYCKPELLALAEALEDLRGAAEWAHVRITIPDGYTAGQFQRRAWTYAQRSGLTVRMRTRPGQLHIQRVPAGTRRRRRA